MDPTIIRVLPENAQALEYISRQTFYGRLRSLPRNKKPEFFITVDTGNNLPSQN